MPPKTRKTSETMDILSSESLKKVIQESLNELLPEILERVLAPIRHKLEELRTENKIISERVDYLEDQLVADQLEIAGVPESVEENTDSIAYKVLSGLKIDKVNLTGAVINSYRLPKPKSSKSNSPPKIVVRLKNPHVRRLAYSNRIKNPISTKDLGYSADKKVYVNERLRPSLRPVFYKLLEKKRNKEVNAVWTYNQSVMMKVNKDDQVKVVKSLEQLQHCI